MRPISLRFKLAFRITLLFVITLAGVAAVQLQFFHADLQRQLFLQERDLSDRSSESANSQFGVSQARPDSGRVPELQIESLIGRAFEITAIAFVAILPLIWLLVYRAFAPLHALREEARLVLSHPGYVRPIRVDSQHEIGELTLEFNHLVQALQRTEQRVFVGAQHDALTGLPNRILLNDRLTLAIERCKRDKQAFAVMYVDIDDFRLLNETRGRAAGDELLVIFARRMESCIRQVDTLARLGQDEFMIILEYQKAASNAREVANKIVTLARDRFALIAANVHVTVSIGIVYVEHSHVVPSELISAADAVLSKVKASGKDGYRLELIGSSLSEEERAVAARVKREPRRASAGP